MPRPKFFREGYPPSAHESEVGFTQSRDFDLDLNSASLEELPRIPVLGPERAKALIDARPFTHWRQVRHLPDFTDAAIEELRKGGARIKNGRASADIR